jgi:glycosyltransferase 2 family protein
MRRSLRVVFAVAILSVLLWLVGAKELVAVFERIDGLMVVYLLFLSIVMLWVSCIKWRVFIRASGHDVSIGKLMKFYTIGYFFNLFTPSVVGGDIARSYHLGKGLGSQKEAFVSTFLERFTGLIAMVCLGAFSVLAGAEVTKGLELSICLLALVTIIAAIVLFSKTLSAFFLGIFTEICFKTLSAKFAGKIETLTRKVDRAFDWARGNPRVITVSLLLSLVYHLLTVLNTHAAALAIGWKDPDIGQLFVVVPLVLMIAMVPITPSGLGLQEGAFLFFLERIGGTRAEGLAVGLVLRAKSVLIGVLGGLILSFEKKTLAHDSSANEAEGAAAGNGR